MENKLICWDLEILNPISDTLGGWDAARRGDCGISALVLSDSETGRFHIYDQHTLDDAVDHLNSADLLIGYNSINFDSEVIFGVTGRYITAPQYDILDEIWKALESRKKGYKLDDVAHATIGRAKNSNGQFATALAQKQHWGRLFDYCLNDVHLTRGIFNHIQDMGWIKGADGQELYLEQPTIKDYA